MTASLSRYANPLTPIGHAGRSAPVLADERLAIADLPRFAATPAAAANGFRASLIQRDAERVRDANRELREALAAVLPLAGRAALTPHDEAIVTRATRALTLGGLL